MINLLEGFKNNICRSARWLYRTWSHTWWLSVSWWHFHKNTSLVHYTVMNSHVLWSISLSESAQCIMVTLLALEVVYRFAYIKGVFRAVLTAIYCATLHNLYEHYYTARNWLRANRKDHIVEIKILKVFSGFLIPINYSTFVFTTPPRCIT